MPKAQPVSDPKRTLMIKCKVCQRLIKEYEHYQKELADNEAIVQEMKQGKKDEYDIKYYQNILNESRMMVPDTHRRLGIALEELAELVATTSNTSTSSITEEDNNDDCEWTNTAQKLLQEHAAIFFIGQDAIQTNVEGLENGEAF